MEDVKNESYYKLWELHDLLVSMLKKEKDERVRLVLGDCIVEVLDEILPY